MTLQYFADIAGIGSFFALLKYAWDTNRMKREMLLQGSASRRPFFKIERADNSQQSRALLSNVGEGIALQVTWRFEEHSLSKFGGDLGAVGVGMRLPLPWAHDGTLLDTNLLEQYPIRVEYEDTAGKRYWSVIKTVERHFVISTGVDPGGYSAGTAYTTLRQEIDVLVHPKAS